MEISGLVELINTVVRSALLLPLWNAIHFLVEVWVFNFPKFLGGFESSDRRQLCANMLGRPYPSITDLVWEELCLPLFYEKLNAYSYLLIVVGIIYLVRLAFWFYFERVVQNIRRRLDPAAQARANERGRETTAINAECKRAVQEFCRILSSTRSHMEKNIDIQDVLAHLPQIVKRDINHPLIAAAHLNANNNVLHLE